MSVTARLRSPIEIKTISDVKRLEASSREVVVISAVVGLEMAGSDCSGPELLAEALRVLQPGGLLFIYGEPETLPQWGEYLMVTPELMEQAVFKYWIAVDLNERPRDGFLQPNHRGILFFVRRDPARKTPPQFKLNVNDVRVPHQSCVACGDNLKDWGGKKHLMNPRGAAPSDVWRDLPRRKLTDGVIPDDVLERIAKLSGATAENSLHLIAMVDGVAQKSGGKIPWRNVAPSATEDKFFASLAQIEPNRVYAGDCISFLHRVEVLHPNGLFDLAFADPPYNLEKSYGKWDDALAERHYLDWCNAWLAGMAATLKPGGSLCVLNLPKWALHHATFLNSCMDFRHWIAWDALSDPRGKLMPAHYALLWYTKPGGKPVCNYSPVGAKPREGFVAPPDSPEYCLRARCIKHRKATGADAKVELSDMWSDIHRIKHKRDRDAHPCQLPDKLMERIIKLATRPGDVVFDPFCGAGTTAIAALKLERKFVVTDVDKDYVRITNAKLASMREHADMFGEFAVPRESTTRKRADVTKREIESYLQQLAHRLNRIPTEADVANDRPGLLREIDLNYSTRNAAFKRAKISFVPS